MPTPMPLATRDRIPVLLLRVIAILHLPPASTRASGANRIFPATAQLAALILDRELSLEEAFHVPRIDCLGVGTVQVDPRMESTVKDEIGEFYDPEIAELAVFPKLYACPQGVMRKDGLCHVISDPSPPSATRWRFECLEKRSQRGADPAETES